MAYVERNNSLSWFDFIWCKVLKNFKGENYLSLESADMAYLLMLFEYSEIESFVQEEQENEPQK